MAIYLNSGFRVFDRYSSNYEGLMVEIEYQDYIVAQLNEDQGEGLFEMEVYVTYESSATLIKFPLKDFLEAVDEAIKLLKEYRFISLYIVSSAEIQREDLISFLKDLGAFIYKELDSSFIATFSKYLQKIDIALDNEGLASLKTTSIELLTQILGDKPQFQFVLELSRKTEAQKLAVELCCAFAERWPAAVILGRTFFSSQQVFDLRSSDDIFTV